jgi:hypothetical protein
VYSQLVAADQDAMVVLGAYHFTDYRAAAFFAQRAFTRLLAAAAAINVPIEPEARSADDMARSSEGFFSDPIEPEFAAPLPPSIRRHGPKQSDASSIAEVEIPAETGWSARP